MIIINDRGINMKFYTIALDFDGTITTLRDASNVDLELQEGCANAIKIIHSMGHKIILNTCRVGKQLESAINWLDKIGLKQYFSLFNENDAYEIACYGTDCRKISADIYIDDRNFGGFPGWDTILEYFVREF